MKPIFTAFFLLTFSAGAIAFAHLCDNVFEQARDNLVVKVDIRDGQLRIGSEASFNVYVLNTMDRDIVEIALEVESAEFEAEVKPGAGWRNYPGLRTARRGGRKEAFNVTLRRKHGIPDGRYRIGLNLVSRRQNLSFRSVDLDSAADMCFIPKIGSIEIDGEATRAEWGEAFLCSDFHAYRKVGRYHENVTADDQMRVRVAHDENNLYLLAMFHGAGEADKDFFSLYAAPTIDDEPVVLAFDRNTGELLESGADIKDVGTAANPQQNLVEIRISKEDLGITDSRRFYMNFTRTVVKDAAREVTFWRGNPQSVMQPVSYAQFVLEGEEPQ